MFIPLQLHLDFSSKWIYVMKNQYPSILLLETWIQLAQTKRFPDAQCSVADKINTIFGSISEAELYLEKEKLKRVNKIG